MFIGIATELTPSLQRSEMFATINPSRMEHVAPLGLRSVLMEFVSINI